MAWIKRNLYFLIGSLVALALMIVGIVMLISQLAEETRVAEEIAAKYSELQRLSQQNPNPGNNVIDNIKGAREQDVALHGVVQKMLPFFQRITPIPDAGTNKISNSDFASQLRNTVSQLHKTASQQSVILPSDYYFTFEAQKKLMVFDAASLERLAVHLGEIKAISEILFDARINSLDNVRREIVSTNDSNPPDYLNQKTVSTPLAELTPYEVTFKCFSSQLAAVMGGLANSPYGLIVKSINVEPSATSLLTTDEAGNALMNTVPSQTAPMTAANAFADPNFTGRRRPPGFANPGAVAQPAPTRGSTVFLNEKPLRVALLIQVVKIKPVK